MNPETAIDASREALKVCMLVGGPILAICLIVGLLMGLAQAMSHIQDQAIATVPKILAILVAVGLMLPWMSETMAEFSKEQFGKPFLGQASGFPTSTAVSTKEKASPLIATPSKTEPNTYYPQLNAAPLRSSSFQKASFERKVETVPATNFKLPSFKLPSVKLPVTKPIETSPNPFSLPSFRFSRSDTDTTEG